MTISNPAATYADLLNGRHVMLYAGQAVKTFTLTLKANDASAFGDIHLAAPDGSALPADVQWTGDGPAKSVTIAADGAVMTINERVKDYFSVQQLQIVYGAGEGFADVEEHLGTHMKSFPIQPNAPVEMFFPQGRNLSYFLTYTVQPGSSDATDVIVDGPGTLQVFREGDSFLADNSHAVLSTTGTGVQYLEIPGTLAGPDRHLLLRLSNGGRGGRVRLFVGHVRDRIGLNLDFIGRREDYADSDDDFNGKLRQIVDSANYFLCQATADQVRITSCHARIRLTPPLITDLPGGIINLPDPVQESAHTSWGVRVMFFKKSWWTEGGDSLPDQGHQLAHEIMHWRYYLRDEYYNPPNAPDQSVPICPGTLMASDVDDELCWSANHVRSLPEAPLTNNPDSGWTLLCRKLGVDAPTVSPPRVFTSVCATQHLFPVTVDLQDLNSPAAVIEDGLHHAGDAIKNAIDNPPHPNPP